jgi:hypothetical protein
MSTFERKILAALSVAFVILLSVTLSLHFLHHVELEVISPEPTHAS